MIDTYGKFCQLFHHLLCTHQHKRLHHTKRLYYFNLQLCFTGKEVKLITEIHSSSMQCYCKIPPVGVRLEYSKYTTPPVYIVSSIITKHHHSTYSMLTVLL